MDKRPPPGGPLFPSFPSVNHGIVTRRNMRGARPVTRDGRVFYPNPVKATVNFSDRTCPFFTQMPLTWAGDFLSLVKSVITGSLRCAVHQQANCVPQVEDS